MKIPKKYAAVGTVAAALVMIAAVATPANGAGGARLASVNPASAAAASADALVVSHPDQILGSTGEAYARGDVVGAGGLSYVPYARTYRGLPVVGGDFVVVTNASVPIAAIPTLDRAGLAALLALLALAGAFVLRRR